MNVRAYAEKNGITVVKHYIDRALSAKTDNRPDFQQMIKDSEKRLFDIVLVWKLDRFARNRYDSVNVRTAPPAANLMKNSFFICRRAVSAVTKPSSC